MTDNNIIADDSAVDEQDIVAVPTTKQRRWFHAPSNVLSLVAVVVTIVLFVVTLVMGAAEDRARKQQEIAQLVDQISALQTEEVDLYSAAVPMNVRSGALMSIANRRHTLINQAESLLADVEDELSKLDLALLATTYVSAGLVKPAERRFLDLANAEEERLAMRVMSWRSLVGIYGLREDRLQDAEDAARAGLELARTDEDDIALRTELVLIPLALANTLTASRRYDDALQQLVAAERDAWKLQCGSSRQELLAVVQSEIAGMLAQAPDLSGGEDLVNSARKQYGARCLGDVMVEPMEVDPEAAAPTEVGHAGVYQLRFNSVTVEPVVPGGGNLRVRGLPGPPRLLVPISDDLFAQDGALGHYIFFQRDTVGNILHLVLLQPNGPFVMQRR